MSLLLAAEIPWRTIGLVAIGLLILFAFIFTILFIKFFKLYIQSRFSGAGVGFWHLVFMWVRGANANVILKAQVMSVQAGLNTDPRRLEAHYLAGGNVMAVVRALIAAHRAQIALDFNQGTAIDLAGRNVLEAVQTSVNPKVIDCPDSGKMSAGGKSLLEAVARNGIQLRTKARVTVRTNLPRLIGGATEDTIIARVGEGIVSAIGSAEDHYAVLANPDRISKQVLAKGLDSQTAFEIVSIDIADIDVGDNIGARLQAEQAEADMRVSRAKAETARAAAVAREQEMTALVAENRAKVVLAEAEIPLAIAHAFREGRLGIMDYYQMRNIQADTDMRAAIASPGRMPTSDMKAPS